MVVLAVLVVLAVQKNVLYATESFRIVPIDEVFVILICVLIVTIIIKRLMKCLDIKSNYTKTTL